MSVVSFVGLSASARSTAVRFVVVVVMALAISTAFSRVDRSAHVPPPQDTPYPGTIAIHVDATDTAQGIFRVHETIPVKQGKLTLLYPKWIPGNHAPTGPVDMLAGLEVGANGKPIRWKRDEYDVYAFHLDVPAGVSRAGRNRRATSTTLPGRSA
ncbi:MAG: hypothetical protein ACRES9_04110 [Gammaproteobacteria bacterium]